jgi:hypothetical protein
MSHRMAIKIAIEKLVNADLNYVFDWWTDLSSDDSKLVKPLKSRKIISKTDSEILLEDEEEMYFKKMKFKVRVILHRPDRWVSEYAGDAATARSEYVLKSESSSRTLLSYNTVIEPSDFFIRFFAPLVRPFIRRVFASEMDIFIRTLEQDYVNHKILK